jgi:hypothetical protein
LHRSTHACCKERTAKAAHATVKLRAAVDRLLPCGCALSWPPPALLASPAILKHAVLRENALSPTAHDLQWDDMTDSLDICESLAQQNGFAQVGAIRFVAEREQPAARTLAPAAHGPSALSAMMQRGRTAFTYGRHSRDDHQNVQDGGCGQAAMCEAAASVHAFMRCWLHGWHSGPQDGGLLQSSARYLLELDATAESVTWLLLMLVRWQLLVATQQ